jgi:hypothetical protein
MKLSSSHERAAVVAVPTLDDVLADRAVLGALPSDILADLRRQLAYLAADVDAALARMPTDRAEGHGRVLTVKEAAEYLRTSEDSLYRKHRTLRLGYLDRLDGKLKVTEAELERYIARQHRP